MSSELGFTKALVLGLVLICGPQLALAQNCDQLWDSGFGQRVGVETRGILTMLTVSENGRDVVYAGGSFTTIGGVSANNIAKWDGNSWTSVGLGFNGIVRALAYWDSDGAGPLASAVIAAGQFNQSGSSQLNSIAQWSGSAWLPLSGGLTFSEGSAGIAYSLTTFDFDFSGPAPSSLIVGGQFDLAGSTSASNIASWDGANWATFGEGRAGSVLCLSTFDADGIGPAPRRLIAGGDFTGATAASAKIAAWDGTSWVALAGGPVTVSPNIAICNALSSFDADGLGPISERLYASYTNANNLHAITSFDGAIWWPSITLGTGKISAFASFDEDGVGVGNSTSVFAGSSTGTIWRLTGPTEYDWMSIAPPGTSIPVNSMTVADLDGPGPDRGALFLAGSFASVFGTFPALGLVEWDGTDWTSRSFSGNGVSAQVRRLRAVDVGTRRYLIATGDFASAGARPSNRIAEWDGDEWTSLKGGLAISSGTDINDIAVFDDGTGPSLYVGGVFNQIGGVQAANVAKWTGKSWAPLGSGTNGVVTALAVFDDGGGPGLFAAGEFFSAGGVPLNRIAKWNGSAWSATGALGSGLGGGTVNALAVFNDGAGTALFAGGIFTSAGGNPQIKFVARWNGLTWSNAGTGGITSGVVNGLHVVADHTGPALFARGSFTMQGFTRRIARFQNLLWSQMDGGVDGDVRDIVAYGGPNGEPPIIFVTGAFTSVGIGTPASNIASWNPDGGLEKWKQPGSIGLNSPGSALAVFDDGSASGSSLFVGGSFTEAGGLAARHIAKWNGNTWSVLWLGRDAGSINVVNALAVFDQDGDGPAPASLYSGGDFQLAGGIQSFYIARWNYCMAPDPIIGDVDCDGAFNIGDIGAFVAVLLGADLDPMHVGRADISGDGTIDGRDIAPFTAGLIGD